MSAMGVVFGVGLAFASNIFKVKVDPKTESILSFLPGANCGVCGKAGCSALAEAIAKGDVSLTTCPLAGEDSYNKIADILGVDKEIATKKIPRVRCGGGNRAKDKYIYQGIKTCAGASLLAGGVKLCNFGCLGFGDCVKACAFNAIHIGEDDVPFIDEKKCTACGRCISVCPKNIISLEDAEKKYYVKCLSQDKIIFVKNACKVGCIACKICEKLSKGAFVIEGNLSRLDYSKVDDKTPVKLCIEKCPTRCIVED